jgi:hypothetical protein
MKYLYNYSIFEKSTLTILGAPIDVMKDIQYNYELSSDATWTKFYKTALKEDLKKDELSLYVEISIKYIKVFINLGNDEYQQQVYKLDDSGWGTFIKKDIELKTRTQLLIGINPEHLIYKLSGDFQYKPKKQRQVQKELKMFDDVTNDFKFYILYNFNKIIKKIYGKRYDFVMQTIAKNISELKGSSSDEILEFLKNNKKLAEKAKEYDNAKAADDILRIQDLEQQFNSLPAIDEYLYTFEEEYSEKYNLRLNIQDLINDFGRMKIETAFMYYLFTGKIKDLTVQKNK